MAVIQGLTTNPVQITPALFWGLIICIIATVILTLYITFFRVTQVATLAPLYTAGTNTASIKDNGSLRKSGQGGSTYFINTIVTPSAGSTWSDFTIVPDGIFDPSRIVSVDAFGTSSTDGTTSTAPSAIMQIMPVWINSKLMVYYFANSVFAHTLNIRFELK